MFLLVINLSRMIANIAWATLIIIILIVLYRLLLRRLKRSRPSQENFLKLHSIEQNPASGTIQIFFDQELPKLVKISIYDTEEKVSDILAQKEFKAGGNIFSIDTTKYPNGNYYLELKTEFQKSSKLFEIKN